MTSSNSQAEACCKCPVTLICQILQCNRHKGLP